METKSDKMCLPLLQRNIKVMSLQILLLDNFLSYGEGVQISLAQIPQNIKKNSSL